MCIKRDGRAMTRSTDIAAVSLLDQPAAPVVSGSLDWVVSVLLGDVATALCVIAFIIIGMLMLTGRFAVKEGFRVVVGCFLLLGAPVVADGLLRSLL